MDVARQKVPKPWVKELTLQLVLGTSRRRVERMPQLWSEALCCHTCQTVWRRDALRKPDVSARYLVWATEPGAMKTQRHFRRIAEKEGRGLGRLRNGCGREALRS